MTSASFWAKSYVRHEKSPPLLTIKIQFNRRYYSERCLFLSQEEALLNIEIEEHVTKKTKLCQPWRTTASQWRLGRVQLWVALTMGPGGKKQICAPQVSTLTRWTCLGLSKSHNSHIFGEKEMQKNGKPKHNGKIPIVCFNAMAFVPIWKRAVKFFQHILERNALQVSPYGYMCPISSMYNEPFYQNRIGLTALRCWHLSCQLWDFWGKKLPISHLSKGQSDLKQNDKTRNYFLV